MRIVINERKFVPIGTICSIKSKNKKIMITGFYSVEYVGKIKMFDYCGCDYPEGLLSSNRNHSFNHEDIVSIETIGYRSEEHEILNNLMLNQSMAYDDSTNENNEFLSNIQFDENGVVVFAPETVRKTEKPLSSIIEKEEMEISNPFTTKHYEDKPEEKSNSDSSQQWPIFKNIQFDENGMIIAAELSEEPLVEESVVEPKEQPMTLQFDENGIVVASGQEV